MQIIQPIIDDFLLSYINWKIGDETCVEMAVDTF